VKDSRLNSPVVSLAVTLGRIALAVAVLTLLSSPAVAQYTPDDMAGAMRPYDSYHGGDIDSVNLGNGNLALHIPLLSYPQRGSDLKVDFQLLYNGRWAQQSITCVQPIDTCGQWSNHVAHIPPYSVAGVYFADIHGATVTNKQIHYTYRGSGAYTYSGPSRTLYQSDGTSHALVNIGTTTVPPSGGTITESGPWRALDGTGWELLSDGTTIVDSAGVKYAGGLPTDRNGNQITANSLPGITDTLGRQIPTLVSTSNTSGCTGPLPIASAALWNPPGLSGGTVTFKFCYANVQTSGYQSGTGSQSMLHSGRGILSSRSRKYSFQLSGSAATFNALRSAATSAALYLFSA
jgi:hypothetical protein